MNITPATRIDQILTAIPEAREVFGELRLDVANREMFSLADACALGGVDLESAIALLDAARNRGGERKSDWRHESLFDLTRYIVEHHHRYARESLVEIETLVRAIHPLHRAHSPQVDRIEQSLRLFRDQMSRHMLEEEQVVFPYIQRLEAASLSDVPIQPPFFETVKRPINRLVVEHGESLELLEEVAWIRDGASLPEDCRIAFDPLFDRVAALVRDIHQHMDLENTILLPRAVRLEASLEPRFSELGELW